MILLKAMVMYYVVTITHICMYTRFQKGSNFFLYMFNQNHNDICIPEPCIRPISPITSKSSITFQQVIHKTFFGDPLLILWFPKELLHPLNKE